MNYTEDWSLSAVTNRHIYSIFVYNVPNLQEGPNNLEFIMESLIQGL